MILIFAAVFPSKAEMTASSCMSTATTADAALPSHHVQNNSSFGPRFTNPWPETWEERNFKDVWAWHKDRKKIGVSMHGHLIGKPFPTAADFQQAFPLQTVDYAALACPDPDAVQALWVGHATVLVQMEGLTFITDPVFSERLVHTCMLLHHVAALPPH